jgi:hypothetical protein
LFQPPCAGLLLNIEHVYLLFVGAIIHTFTVSQESSCGSTVSGIYIHFLFSFILSQFLALCV